MTTVPHYTWYVVFWSLLLGPPCVALTWGIPKIVRLLTAILAAVQR